MKGWAHGLVLGESEPTHAYYIRSLLDECSPDSKEPVYMLFCPSPQFCYPGVIFYPLGRSSNHASTTQHKNGRRLGKAITHVLPCVYMVQVKHWFLVG